jgi:two-component system NtrC family sensor kinase
VGDTDQAMQVPSAQALSTDQRAGRERRFGLGLPARLAILTALLAMALVLGGNEVALSWSERSHIDEDRLEATTLATTLASYLVSIAPYGSPDSLTRAFDSWEETDISGAGATLFLHRDGALVPLRPASAGPPDGLAERAFADRTTHTRFTAKPDDAWEIAVPLGDHRVYGVLSVTVATQQMAKLAAERRRTYALAIASALLLALAVLWLTSFWVGRPLIELGRAMARARDTATTPPQAPEIGPAEFQVVAQRYNELLRALADRERESQARAALLVLEAQARDYDRLAVTAETTAGLAHEIGTPLSTMRGHIQLLRDDLAKSGQSGSVERINSLLAQLDRVTDIVRAGMERGAWPQPALRAADLTDVVTRMLRFLEPSLDQAGVRARLAENGGGSERAVANCDPDLVEQILLNLLKNAIEALPPGGNIRLATGTQNGNAFVVVADDGPGLSPEIRAYLFNPFTTTKGSAGTGLGLAVSRRLARSLGGELVYVPTASGTEWRLTLPAVSAS